MLENQASVTVAWKQLPSLNPETNDIAVLSKPCNSIATEGNLSPEAGHAHTVERGNILKRNAQPEMQSVFDVNALATTANVVTQS